MSKTRNLLIAVLVLQFVALIYLVLRINTLNDSLASTKADLSQQKINLLREVDNQKSLQKPVVLPKEKLIIFTEFGISLPYNSVTKTFQYALDEDMDVDEVNIRVTSTLISDHKDRQQSCTDLVRLNLKNGSLFSPWEEVAGTVKLSNGQTLYIITTKAFKNNEASTEECAKEVWTQLSPNQVAEEFKKARAY